MKKCLVMVALSLATATALTSDALAQGTVNFRDLTEPISYRPIGWGMGFPPVPLPSGQAGSFYFALLTAPMGTTDTTQFTFSGLYATNRNNAGLLDGPLGAAVNGWIPGTSREFYVIGWSADGGVAYDPGWLNGGPSLYPAYFGVSIVGSGFAGGVDPVTGGPIPALNIFGAAPSINQGFVLEWIPEPTTATLVAFGGLCAAMLRRRTWSRNAAQQNLSA